jgi:hypothetical protein
MTDRYEDGALGSLGNRPSIQGACGASLSSTKMS